MNSLRNRRQEFTNRTSHSLTTGMSPGIHSTFHLPCAGRRRTSSSLSSSHSCPVTAQLSNTSSVLDSELRRPSRRLSRAVSTMVLSSVLSRICPSSPLCQCLRTHLEEALLSLRLQSCQARSLSALTLLEDRTTWREA